MTAVHDVSGAIAHCLAYPDAPTAELSDLVQRVLALPPEADRATLTALAQSIAADLVAARGVALVYGGATKIKEYVFEAPRLPEIRGASALLDWVNEQALDQLWHQRLPGQGNPGEPHPFIVYASGGAFLAFAPAELGRELAIAVERLYTTHTLTANSAAVAGTFDLLELRYGRLYPTAQRDTIYWVEDFLAACADPAQRATLFAYYYPPDGVDPTAVDASALRKRFFNRKTFGELVTLLATRFYRRRSERATYGEQRNLPHYDLMPWAQKCVGSDVRPAVITADVGSDSRQLSEATARKLAVGRQVKGVRMGGIAADLKPWDVPTIASWEQRWEKYLASAAGRASAYAQAEGASDARAARDLREIGAAAQPRRYIGLIYADGNNIGRLMATLTDPAIYRQVSQALTDVARDAVFTALGTHLRPAWVVDEERERKPGWVHPFEILTIGGDDLLLVVPGDQAFAIALTIAQTFERRLTEQLGALHLGNPSAPIAARYAGSDATAEALRTFAPSVGLSAGVLIAHENAPFFFLRNLVEELLGNAKRLSRRTAAPPGHDDPARSRFFGGAVDFMTLKSTTMVTDKIATFRQTALGDYPASPRRLTARPYSWAEFAGLLATVQALKQAGMPRSQLYRLRRALDNDQGEGGVLVSVMEYLYTRARLRKPLAEALLTHIEAAWGHGPLFTAGRKAVPPWMPRGAAGYETIWPDLLEAYEFVAQREAV